jgi:hypothetical protein
MDNLPLKYLNLKEEYYEQIHLRVENNSGLTIKEYVKLIKCYNFDEKTLEFVFRMVNTNPNSFYNVCGPFIKKDDKWYIFDEKKDDKKLIKDLKKENILLRKKLKKIQTCLPALR